MRPRSTQSAYAPRSARCRCHVNRAIAAVTADDADPQLAGWGEAACVWGGGPGGRAEGQPAARVALPPAPVSSDLAPVDEDDMRRVQPDRRKGADLGGDGDPLRSCADDSEGRHHPRIVPSPPAGA